MTTTTPPPSISGAPSAGPRDTRAALATATAATVLLWFMPYSNYLLYPLRLFVTFVHEGGHALAALVSGGSVASIRVLSNGEGVTQTWIDPHWSWLVYSGGYLGTAVFGAILLQVARARRASAGRTTLYATAGYIGLLTLLWAHDPFTNLFTLVSGAVIALLIWAAARYSSNRTADFIAAFLAVQCSLNALTDLRILVRLTHEQIGDNDAVFMQRAYHWLPFSAEFYAVLWAALGLVILIASLRSYLRSAALPKLRRT